MKNQLPPPTPPYTGGVRGGSLSASLVRLESKIINQEIPNQQYSMISFLQVENLSKRFGEQLLFENITLESAKIKR